MVIIQFRWPMLVSVNDFSVLAFTHKAFLARLTSHKWVNVHFPSRPVWSCWAGGGFYGQVTSRLHSVIPQGWILSAWVTLSLIEKLLHV